MPCLHCAAPLADDAIFCPHCGTPAYNPTTVDLHRRMALLNERWARGELSAPAYEQESQALMQFDPWGRAWLPGAEPGAWQVHHEGQWRPYVAPLAERMATVSPPRQAAIPAATRKTPWRAILGGVGGVALLMVAVWFGLKVLGRPAEEAKGITPITPGATAQAAVVKGASPTTALAGPTTAVAAPLAPAILAPMPLATSTPGPPKPTMTPISRVEVFAWDHGAFSLPFAVWDGAGQVTDGAYCLTPSGEWPVRAGLDPQATDLSLQARVTMPQVEGGSAGLLGCGVLLEVNRRGQWRQRAVDEIGYPTEEGEWLQAEGLRAADSYDLGLLCESGSAGRPGLLALVVDGIIVTRETPLSAPAPLAGFYVALPSGAGSARACLDDWRLEVWPGAGPGHPADDREPVLAELGRPHAFSLTFEQEPEGGLYRVETWTYADVGMTFTFVDGVLIETAGVDTESSEIVVWPVDYDPLAFTPEMTLEQVKALLGGQELVSLEVPVEFGEGMVFYAGDQIIIGFTEGTLEFVETLPITVEETL